MHFTRVLQSLSLVAVSSAVTVAYDEGYDLRDRSLGAVACSDGENGLLSRYPTQGSLPSFPYIGGAEAIAGWNSANCGTCWTLSYNGTSINVLAIDRSAQGFTVTLAALNALAGGNAGFVGRIDAAATQVDKSVCGL